MYSDFSQKDKMTRTEFMWNSLEISNWMHLNIRKYDCGCNIDRKRKVYLHWSM